MLVAKYIGKSKKYKGVYIWINGNKIFYCGGTKKMKMFHNEKDAALWYDAQRIMEGKKPVNILKKFKPGTGETEQQ
jgi:hypothetical protein